MAYLPKPKKNSKRTSLVPTWMNKKNKLNNNQIENQPKLENNVPDNADTSIPNIEFVNKTHPYEKVTLKNTTTRSVERVNTDGSYTNAVETNEQVEERVKYGDVKDSFDKNNVLDIYPVEEKVNTPTKTINSKPPKLIEEDLDKSNYSNSLKMVRQDGLLLKNISEQTVGLCLEAVKQNGLALKYAKYQNEMICLTAISKNIDAYKYIHNKTHKINLRAVQIDSSIIRDIDAPDQTEDIALASLVQNGLYLKYIRNQTPKICMAAIKQNIAAFTYVRNKTENICNEVVKRNGLALEFIKNQTPEICMNAIKQNPFALEFVIEQTYDLCEAAIFRSGLALEYVKDKTTDLCLLALQQNYQAIQYVPYSLLSGSLDLSDYVFICVGTKSIIPNIPEIRGLKRINLSDNETGYNIINALTYNELPVNFIVEKGNYINDELIKDLKDYNHFVVEIEEKFIKS